MCPMLFEQLLNIPQVQSEYLRVGRLFRFNLPFLCVQPESKRNFLFSPVSVHKKLPETSLWSDILRLEVHALFPLPDVVSGWCSKTDPIVSSQLLFVTWICGHTILSEAAEPLKDEPSFGFRTCIIDGTKWTNPRHSSASDSRTHGKVVKFTPQEQFSKATWCRLSTFPAGFKLAQTRSTSCRGARCESEKIHFPRHVSPGTRVRRGYPQGSLHSRHVVK